MTTRRKFLKTAGLGAAATALAAPAVRGQTKIKWRLQTYAGPALAEHVIKPHIEMSCNRMTIPWPAPRK